MKKHIESRRIFPGMLVASAALVLSSPAFAAPYSLKLTSDGDGANNGAVYYSPYMGTISQGGMQVYSGYFVCDDFHTETHVGETWTATETNAGALNWTEKFAGETYKVGGQTYDTQQLYDAAGWLVNDLLVGSNVHNHAAQGDLSFAIWDIFDGTAANGVVLTDIEDAFGAVKGGYVASNVEVFTADPPSGAQEFMVPVSVPEPMTLALFAVGLAGVGLRLRTRSR
jgi:PEP-CTERM motif